MARAKEKNKSIRYLYYGFHGHIAREVVGNGKCASNRFDFYRDGEWINDWDLSLHLSDAVMDFDGYSDWDYEELTEEEAMRRIALDDSNNKNAVDKTKKRFPYRKVLIVGCGGAGKSTLAVEMGKRFGLPIVHLDKLWWLPDWQTRSEQEFDVFLAAELAKNDWIIEGNFFRTFKTRLKHADFCIFLDYDTELCIQSVYERAEKYKGVTRPDMTDGCVEQVDDKFKNWITSFKENVRPSMLSELENGTTPYMVFQTRETTASWLDGFSDD